MNKSGLNYTAFLAAGVVITAGFFGGLVVIVAFASPEHINQYLVLLFCIFGFILLIPLNAMRQPKMREEKVVRKKKRSFLRWLLRRKKGPQQDRTEWKRRTGQRSNTVPGQVQSTFVRSPRKPTGA